MTEFLRSIKSDLLSRRMLPFLVVLGLALIAAVGYAITGGSGGSVPAVSASVPSTSASGAAGATGSTSVSVAPTNPEQAVSETPGGVRYQSQGPTRDPFVPLPTPKAATSTSLSKSSSSSSTSSSGGSSSGGGGSSSVGKGSGGNSAPAPAKPSKPSKPQNPYTVAVLFGLTSTTPGLPTTLAPYPSLNLQQPLPSKQDARIVFERVTSTGKGAIFKLLVPPILHGTGICLPSTSECQTIDLEVGQSEELEYVEVSGQSVTYELKVVSIAKNSGAASTARVKRTASTAQVKHLTGVVRAKRKAHVARAKRK
jgi:hypothetical protein